MENTLTPAMKQFVHFKRQYPKSLLLFRMGDFYETFYDDAKEMSRILNITLTKRGNKNAVPLAGIPYHALNNYLQKLVKAGKTITIIEQIEDPKLAKGRVVKRDVLRTITPGTIIEQEYLDSKTNNYLLSIFVGNKVGVSFTDISTGEFNVFETTKENLLNDLIRIKPAEILVLENSDNKFIENIKKVLKATITEQPIIYFNKDFGEEEIKEHFNILSLKSFNIENKTEIIASSGALLNYIKYTQRSKLKHIKKIRFFNLKDHMILDIHSINNLEIITNTDGGKNNTLLSVLDFTQTPMGGRLLKKNLIMPLKNKITIDKRLNIVEKIIKKNIIDDLEFILKNFPDLERLLAKIMYGTGGPRELIAIKEAIKKSIVISQYIKSVEFKDLEFDIDEKLHNLYELIEKTIINEPKIMYKEGGFIKKGFHKELDELLDLKDNNKKILLEIEKRERDKTGIKNLKVGFNRVFGYFIDIPKSQHHLVPIEYTRKQTLVNNERYITEELKRLEEKITTAEEKSKALELEILESILETTKTQFDLCSNLAKNIANIDFFFSLSKCAIQNDYIKPKISEDFNLKIINGRHPVIELLEQEKFVKNDLLMDNEKNNIIILTGPNMAGKSTYLRQNAIIILMAHIGSFVPADSAIIPLTDRIFTRIGARDNLALGLSTFMVEMIETANILNNATDKSFIILDELGRGTSTYDGLSIAMSVLEYIYNKIGAKTLFATHYHQITNLENKYSGISNFYITAKEFDNKIIFLRKVVSGAIDKSYGIAVAKLAGLPDDIITNALQIESMLENNTIDKKIFNDLKTKSINNQKTLFDKK